MVTVCDHLPPLEEPDEIDQLIPWLLAAASAQINLLPVALKLDLPARGVSGVPSQSGPIGCYLYGRGARAA